jgi:hypothetical protein
MAFVLDMRGAIPSGDKVEFTNFHRELYLDVSRYLLRVQYMLLLPKFFT